jgi:hypothetical protein
MGNEVAAYFRFANLRKNRKSYIEDAQVKTAAGVTKLGVKAIFSLSADDAKSKLLSSIKKMGGNTELVKFTNVSNGANTTVYPRDYGPFPLKNIATGKWVWSGGI